MLLDRLSAEDWVRRHQMERHPVDTFQSGPNFEVLGFQGESAGDVDPVTGNVTLSSGHASWASQLRNP